MFLWFFLSCHVVPLLLHVFKVVQYTCNGWQVGWEGEIDVPMKRACSQQESSLNLFIQLVAYCVRSLCLNLARHANHGRQRVLVILQSRRLTIQDTMDRQEVWYYFWAVQIFEFSTMWNGWLAWMHCLCINYSHNMLELTRDFAVNFSQNTHAFSWSVVIANCQSQFCMQPFECWWNFALYVPSIFIYIFIIMPSGSTAYIHKHNQQSAVNKAQRNFSSTDVTIVP